MLSPISIPIPSDTLQSTIRLPRVLSNTLLVYRVNPHSSLQRCSDSNVLLMPLLQHTSHPSETHYFPLLKTNHNSPILLHTHASAPYVPSTYSRGLNLTIHSPGECKVERIDIKLDSWGTIGRWGVRYWSAVGSWAVGVVTLMICMGWGTSERGTIVLAQVHCLVTDKMFSNGPACLLLTEVFYADATGYYACITCLVVAAFASRLVAREWG